MKQELRTDPRVGRMFPVDNLHLPHLGHLGYFLGLEITHSTDSLYITQAKYASDLLSRAGLTNNKTVDTPVELNAHQIGRAHV